MKYFLFFLILIPTAIASTIGVYPTKIYFNDNQLENNVKILTKNDYIVKSDLDIFTFQKEENELKITLKTNTLPIGFYQSYIVIQENNGKLSPALAVRAFINITKQPERQYLAQETEITSYAVRKEPLDVDSIYLLALALVIIIAIMAISLKYIPKNIFSRRKCRRH